MSSLESLPPIILYAMLALCLPVCHEPISRDVEQVNRICDFCSEMAWGLLCENYSRQQFDEAHFQALCLLAQVDFASKRLRSFTRLRYTRANWTSAGKIARAQSQVSLGLKLAQTKGMLGSRAISDANSTAPNTQSPIVWTLFMMDRIIGTAGNSTPSPSSLFSLPVYQAGPARPDSMTDTPKSFMLSDPMNVRSSLSSPSVIAVLIELLDIWGEIITHIFQSTPDESSPFWRHDSSRARISTRLLEFELSKCAYPITKPFQAKSSAEVKLHTYTSTGSPSRVIQEPNLRQYYLARFFLHFVHTGALCCMYETPCCEWSKTNCSRNHPFIIFVNTQHLQGCVPWSFLQSSYKISTVNSDWIVMLITDMQRSNLYLHDPFVGYLVVIAATIQLDKSLHHNNEIAGPAMQKFEKCRDYVKFLSTYWPSMKNAVGVHTNCMKVH